MKVSRTITTNIVKGTVNGKEVPPALNDAAEEYLKDCKRRGFAAYTVYDYRLRLRKFFLWLQEHYPGIQSPVDIPKEAVADYQMHLYKAVSVRKKRLAIATQHRWLGIVLWWLRWLLTQEKILINPAAGIQLPRRPQRIPRNYLSLREMQKLLRAPDLSTHIGLRNRAMLEVLYSTGIRAGELRRLKIDHLNLQEGWLTVVQGKGGKDRVVPLGKAAIHFLLEYMGKSRPALMKKKEHDCVFVTQYGTPISYDSIQIALAKTAKAAGIKRKITPHALRHTCATLMLRGKADIRHIQEMLGHSSLSSTQIYTKVEISDLKKVHAKCHPREKEPIEKK
jgi:integrase/recombinase XerD